MSNHIIFFSGGKSSFAVADFVKESFPNDNIILYFTDTLWEDADLYRFIYEASDKLQLPLLVHSKGITPPQLMILQRFMANSRVGICSKELKMKVSADFIKKGKKPKIEKWINHKYLKNEDFLSNPALYFGIGIGELHREEPIRVNWSPFEVSMPLITNMIDPDEVLKKHKIKTPQLYIEKFSHNNCGGRCIKGGQAHFKNLLLKRGESFIALKEQEIIISDYIRYTKQTSYSKERDYMIKDVWEFVSSGKKSPKIQHLLDTHKYTKNWNFGNRNKPYTFMKSMSLEELEKDPIQCDIFDFGGCNCFVDFDFSDTDFIEESNNQIAMAI